MMSSFSLFLLAWTTHQGSGACSHFTAAFTSRTKRLLGRMMDDGLSTNHHPRSRSPLRLLSIPARSRRLSLWRRRLSRLSLPAPHSAPPVHPANMEDNINLAICFRKHHSTCLLGLSWLSLCLDSSRATFSWLNSSCNKICQSSTSLKASWMSPKWPNFAFLDRHLLSGQFFFDQRGAGARNKTKKSKEDPRYKSYCHLDFSLNESQVFECFRGAGRRLPWPIKLLRRSWFFS